MRDDLGARKMEEASDALFDIEHMGAWLMAAVAIGLGAVGLLVGFDIIELRSGEPGEVGGLPASFLDGAMLIFAGITAGILAYTLHSTEHHRGRSPVTETDRSLWTFEHGLAYLMAVGSIALVVIGLIAGFGAFDNDNEQLDGLLWIWTGFGAGILAATLHSVRHHQAVETDEMIAIVTERVRLSQGPVVTREERRSL
jgi:hypothetical protein